MNTILQNLKLLFALTIIYMDGMINQEIVDLLKKYQKEQEEMKTSSQSNLFNPYYNKDINVFFNPESSIYMYIHSYERINVPEIKNFAVKCIKNKNISYNIELIMVLAACNDLKNDILISQILYEKISKYIVEKNVDVDFILNKMKENNINPDIFFAHILEPYMLPKED